MQKLIVVGNLGKTPENRTTAKGADMVSFSVASNDGKSTTWHNVTTFDPDLMGACAKFSKGDQVIITGTVRARAYSKRGSDELGASLDVTLQSIESLNDSSISSPASKEVLHKAPPKNFDFSVFSDLDEIDIPF